MNRIGTGLCAFVLTLAAALGCGDDAKPQQSGNAGTAGKTTGGGDGEARAGEGGSLSTAGSSVEGGSAQGGEPVEPGGAGEAGEAGAGDMPNSCQGVSTQGECITLRIARACVVPTGNGTPMLVTTSCRSFEHCDVASGQARCVLDDGACIPEQTECINDKQLRTCSAKGAWQTQTCPGSCRDSAVGGFCVQAGATTTFNGTLTYDAAQVYDDYSDWADTFTPLPAEGVLVLSADGDQWLDATLVDAKGAYSIQVPSTKSGDEQLVFFLLHLDPTGAVAQIGVFEPDVANGVVTTDTQLTGNPWSWAVALADAIATPAIRISEEQGSGAIHVYTRLLAVHGYVSEFYQKNPGTIVAWLKLNTAWDCGTCFTGTPVVVSSTPFDSQMFVSADAQDRSYWSDAVTIHEAGHYTMWSYGFPPNEGGQHCLSLPSAPGLAWSEGWATGFSSILRASPIYWDKQAGSMFWFDLGQRHYDQASWQRPNPKGSLLQDMDENEVAAMLWSLASNADVGPDKTLLGLIAPSVTEPTFKRGYTRHEWETQDCKRIGFHDTGETAPMFADYLDGLACSGTSTVAIDAATDPKQAYPYPSRAPLCP